MNISCITNAELSHFLRREHSVSESGDEFDLVRVFVDILRRANEFVPSEAGSIFLDEPLLDDVSGEETGPRELALVTCFGVRSKDILGLRLPVDLGVAGWVYQTGKPYLSSEPEKDPLFNEGPGIGIDFRVRSLLCTPLRVAGEAIGVIELLNHLGGEGYQDADRNLLDIFAQTISASVVNAIDAHRAREMAQRDDLTGLFNDRHLHRSLTRIVENCLKFKRDCGLLFLDLDHFKSINDTYGHLIGSRVLHEVGLILHRILPGEAVAARYGGDEFVVVLPGHAAQETLWVAEAVRQSIGDAVYLMEEDPVDPANYPALQIRNVISCSIGIANFRELPARLFRKPDLLSLKNELMRLADARMYEAKESGRNCISRSL